jgi:choline monooxygenase
VDAGLALEQGYTLPWAWYADLEVLRLEQERIFGRAWQYAGRLDQLARPGDHFACRAGDLPIVVTRDGSGRLEAFADVRRPARAGERARSARVDTWGRFVFVNPDVDADPLADTLGELPELVAESGVDLETIPFRERTHYALAANWKVAVENFLECYHCPVAHQEFSQAVDVDPERYVLRSHGLVGTQLAERRDELGGRCQFHLLWPNLKVNIFERPANASVGPLIPDGPDRALGFFDYFFGTDVSEDEVLEFLAFDDQVGREDTVLVESVQQGLCSGAVEHGRLLAESEQLIAHFQRLTHGALLRL